MGPLYTAIIHLREPATPIVQRLVLPALGAIPGIGDTEHIPGEALLAVTFDAERARLPDIIRVIEDAGSPVAAVGQRLARVARRLRGHART